MNAQATKRKVILALLLSVIYLLSAIFDCYPTVVAPIVVVLIGVTFFFPSFVGRSDKNTETLAPAADEVDSDAPEPDSSQVQTDS